MNYYLLYFIYNFIFGVNGLNSYDFSGIRTDSDAKTQSNSVKSLIERLIKYKVKYFDIDVDFNLLSNDRDVINILKTTDSDVVQIKASSGVAAAWGFHHYLKYYCNCHISWDGDQVSSLEVSGLPEVNETIVANDRFRYYQNVCTSSYSFIWWDEKRWIREIDWMALNGINLALAFNGQEEIWRRVYLKLGLTQDEIDEHFAGPGFLAWGRMGNIRGWGGPLPTSWHEMSVKLQIKILKQMRTIGITPVLPAFSGQVPRAFKRLFPNSSLTEFDKWNRFPDKYCCSYLLSPEDELFHSVGKLFLKYYIDQFGTDHIYNCDTFNEMTPSSGDLSYLQSVGQGIYKAMSEVDDKAIWLLQGWLFHHEILFWTKSRAKAFLTSVPLGKMVVLDLQAELNPQYERLDSFFGQPYIWCMLHNFGGNLGMHGSVENVNLGTFVARNASNSSLVGTGLTPEGINQNYVVYDLMNEMAWRKEPVNLTQWFIDYSIRRYGIDNPHTKQLWQLLRASVYNYKGTIPIHGKYIYVHSPNLHLVSNLWYNSNDVMSAWDEVILALDSWPKNTTNPKTFLYDIVDVSRQSMQLLLDDTYLKIMENYNKKKIDDFLLECYTFLSLLSSMEELLLSNKEFLLKPWIESAKNLATNPTESALYEMNARNQITLWGPNGEIKDYANKQWAGLIRHYYQPRWKMFLEYIENVLMNPRVHFNQTQIEEKMFCEVESKFSFSLDPIVENYSGKAPTVVKKIYNSWRRYYYKADDISVIMV